ncbi:alpha/beta fold hydrolase [Inhella proteolytica]|uniref:Alpha/beta fold hydrolase n=1 Tax=Inhella proteolytica TaxID=2795029 RepID=A0A931NFZ7_9BURK|nr:alpha/beta fold hydrolase [Inhella proteolytica]MBH9576631.1 alpha/beta fold hydrolase [Inhella proteolytica]
MALWILLSGLAATLASGASLWWRHPRWSRPALLHLNRWAAGLRASQLQVAGHRLQLLSSRQHDPDDTPVVLLHGLFAEKDHWVDFARALPGRRRLIVPDLPGFGQSERLDSQRYGYAEQLERLAALLDALGIARAHLAGSSMGGALAALFAQRHPERVASLAFIGAPHGLRSSRPSPVDRLIDAGQAPLLARTAAEFDTLLQRLFARRPWLPYPVLQAARQEAVARASSNLRLWREHVADRYLLQQRLAGLRLPVLALWGRQDQVFDASGAALLKALLPQAEVRLLEGIGHLPMMEAPADCARTYGEFLAGKG